MNGLFCSPSGGGVKVYINNEPCEIDKLKLYSSISNINYGIIPYSYYNGTALLFNGEIHLIGGNHNSTYPTNHYKWNGLSWEEVSTLPYDYNNYRTGAVVFQNAIHLCYYENSYHNMAVHYKWDGNEWNQVSDPSFTTSYGTLIAYNNALHYISPTEHYIWDGSTWSENLSSLPSGVNTITDAVIYNNEIHLITQTQHYKYSNNEWELISSSIVARDSKIAVWDNKIYILGGYYSGTNYYYFDGTSWNNAPSASYLPYNFKQGSAIVTANGIHLIGSSDSTYNQYHYGFNNILYTAL